MSDVTKQITIRLIGLLVMVAVAVAVGLTVLRPIGPRPHPAISVLHPAALVEPVPGAVLPVQAGVVLPTVGANSPVPTTAALRRKLDSLIAAKALGSAVSVDVLDPLTGQQLMVNGQTTPREPASTAKLLTSAAVLSLVGPDSTLPTTVVTGNTSDQLVLVGGGDILLSKGTNDPSQVDGRAGLTTLAQQTARALRAAGRSSGRRQFRLALDDQLFTGPTEAPGWAPTDVSDGFVAPIAALEINEAKLNSAGYAPRSADPSLAAAQVFVGLLKKQGVSVSGPVTRTTAPKQATVLGQVQSAPISSLVEYALTYSDNTVAETLGRLVAAKSGGLAGFAQVGPAVLAQDQKLGIPVAGAELADGSGLSKSSRVPPVALTGVLVAAIGPDHLQLRPILSGMPIADVSGTLAARYTDPRERPAAGVVRAKTGTLTGVTSLVGTVVDADGRLLVFAVMADQVKSTDPARAALDQVASTLATCGCR